MTDEPYQPFKERMRHDPWRMMTGCVLANRTNWNAVAAPVHEAIHKRWPTVAKLWAANRFELQTMLVPVGMQERRAIGLKALAEKWLCRGQPEGYAIVPTYPLLGPYAQDAWRIFIDGDVGFQPEDGRLKAFLSDRAPWLQQRGEHWW
jgi:hypothetical protein